MYKEGFEVITKLYSLEGGGENKVKLLFSDKSMVFSCKTMLNHWRYRKVLRIQLVGNLIRFSLKGMKVSYHVRLGNIVVFTMMVAKRIKILWQNNAWKNIAKELIMTAFLAH